MELANSILVRILRFDLCGGVHCITIFWQSTSESAKIALPYANSVMLTHTQPSNR